MAMNYFQCLSLSFGPELLHMNAPFKYLIIIVLSFIWHIAFCTEVVSKYDVSSTSYAWSILKYLLNTWKITKAFYLKANKPQRHT